MIKTVKQWLSPARKNDEAQEQDNLLQLATYMNLTTITGSVDSQMGKIKFKVLYKDPFIMILDNFLSAEECNEVVALGLQFCKRSMVDEVSDSARKTTCYSQSRTSRTAFFTEKQVNETVLDTISKRVAAISGLPDCHNELQFVTYKAGQEFGPHYDGAHRRYSFFIYLNDLPKADKRGNTVFPNLDLKVHPRRGSALLWRNTLPSTAEVNAPVQQPYEAIKRLFAAPQACLPVFSTTLPHLLLPKQPSTGGEQKTESRGVVGNVGSGGSGGKGDMSSRRRNASSGTRPGQGKSENGESQHREQGMHGTQKNEEDEKEERGQTGLKSDGTTSGEGMKEAESSTTSPQTPVGPSAPEFLVAASVADNSKAKEGLLERKDLRTLHFAEPPLQGPKHGMNAWVHPDPQEYIT